MPVYVPKSTGVKCITCAEVIMNIEGENIILYLYIICHVSYNIDIVDRLVRVVCICIIILCCQRRSHD